MLVLGTSVKGGVAAAAEFAAVVEDAVTAPYNVEPIRDWHSPSSHHPFQQTP